MVQKSWCSLLKSNHLDSFGILEDYESFIDYDSSWMLLTYKIESFGLLPDLRRLRKRKATILFCELEMSIYGWLCTSCFRFYEYRSSLTQEILNIDLIHSFKNEWIVWLWISKLQFYVKKVLPLPSTSLALPPFLSRNFSARTSSYLRGGFILAWLMRKMPQDAADLVVVIQYKHQTTELKILGRNCGWRFLQGSQLQSLQNGIPGNIRGNTWATTAATKFGTLNLLRLETSGRQVTSGAILGPGGWHCFRCNTKFFLLNSWLTATKT